MHLNSAKVIVGVLISTLLSQIVVLMLVALAAWRWHPGGIQNFWTLIRLSWPGIATAGATMSSFAALPELFTLDFIKENHERRSLLNLGIALNKLGATAYLAAAGGFITLLANATHPNPLVTFKLVTLVLMFSVLTPIFAGRGSVRRRFCAGTGSAVHYRPVGPGLVGDVDRTFARSSCHYGQHHREFGCQYVHRARPHS